MRHFFRFNFEIIKDKVIQLIQKQKTIVLATCVNERVTARLYLANIKNIFE